MPNMLYETNLHTVNELMHVCSRTVFLLFFYYFPFTPGHSLPGNCSALVAGGMHEVQFRYHGPMSDEQVHLCRFSVSPVYPSCMNGRKSFYLTSRCAESIAIFVLLQGIRVRRVLCPYPRA